MWTGNGNATFTVDELLRGKGIARGKDVVWSLLSVLDIAIAQEVVLHGDLTAKMVYDMAWDKAAHRPIDPQTPNLKPEQTNAIKLLSNANNPWLAKNVVLMALRESLYSTNTGGDSSVPYEKATTILSSVVDIGAPRDAKQGPLSDEQKKAISSENDKKTLEANFALRGIFDLPDTIKFGAEDSDDAFRGRIRRIVITSGPYKLELPSPDEYRTGQLSYPPSLMTLLRLRDVMADRLVDYQLVSGISDPEQKKRVAALLFSGLGSLRQWNTHPESAMSDSKR
jgi:hypothetical protein